MIPEYFDFYNFSWMTYLSGDDIIQHLGMDN